MVKACADAGAPLSCGAITTTHPSFERAKHLVTSGEIGDVISIEAGGPTAQHQNWSYFLDSPPAWVIGTNDPPRAESGSDEFQGQGHVGRAGRHGRALPKGRAGRADCGDHRRAWLLPRTRRSVGLAAVQGRPVAGRGGSQAAHGDAVRRPAIPAPYGAIYSLNDVMRCIAGEMDEPKNSGRRVAVALEVEVALKLSSDMGGVRVDLPLEDRSLGLNYDWFR